MPPRFKKTPVPRLVETDKSIAYALQSAGMQIASADFLDVVMERVVSSNQVQITVLVTRSQVTTTVLTPEVGKEILTCGISEDSVPKHPTQSRNQAPKKRSEESEPEKGKEAAKNS